MVWKLSEADEAAMSTVLPLDAPQNPGADDHPRPWIVHLLEVNTMNFCSFSACPEHADPDSDGLLVAVPNTLASEAVSRAPVPPPTASEVAASSRTA